MNRRELVLVCGAAVGAAAIKAIPAAAQPTPQSVPPGPPVPRWLNVAERNKPVLNEAVQPPLGLVRAVRDDNLVLRYRMEVEAPGDALASRTLHKGDSVIVDFGGHRTGHLSFRLETQGRSPDSPARLRFVFGEVPTDVAEPLYPYTGQLSQSWLPDEIVNIDDLPQSVEMPRRYAFRYVKIEVIDTSPGYGVQFHDIRAHALTAAKLTPEPLPASTPEIFRRIDEVSVATLRDCLQTTFEDGPRRDRRLWIGDLRLQALTNYCTFKQNDVVKRCLYLFAAFPRADGLVNACVYEKPTPTYGGIVIFDYAALYNVALHDYVEATGDLETGHDLWPVAKRQLEILGQAVGPDGLFVDPKNTWLFIDWATELDRTAAIQGVLIYAYRQTLALARRLGREQEVADYPAQITRMTEAARKTLYDPQAGVFVSGPNRQVSWASQAWLTIAGVPATPAIAARALRTAIASPASVKPTTPYLYHYTVDALLACGLKADARAMVESYWGGMVKAGADTFWEVYDPAHPLSSPYGDIHINSYCHAWSCTPAYLLRARHLV
jgi:alpha-L-rhamnosidase